MGGMALQGRARSAAAAAAIVLFALLAAVPAAPARAAPEVGRPAPPLMLRLLDGGSFDLAALRGRVVIINFWATWCPPCREEMPALDAFYRQYRDRGLDLVGISVDRPRDRAEVGRLMQPFSYPAAAVGEARENGFGSPRVLPVTWIVDAEGVVRARLTPDETAVTEKSLSDAVLPLLR